MSKRMTDEERIVNFFTNESLDKAETLLNVIHGIMRTRKPKEKKATRRTNANAARDASTGPEPVVRSAAI